MRGWKAPASLLLATLAVLATAGPGAAQLRLRDRFWFCPAPGSLDMLELFESPEAWSRARDRVQVFKFYQQHTMPGAPAIVGPNHYEALVRAGAFRTVVREWRKRIALEAGSVKAFYCTADERGMRESVAATLRSLDAIRDAGGTVTYLTMDEPFIGGLSPACGGPALEPTADRLQIYMNAVNAAYPSLRIGLIEAYPTFSPDEFAAMLRLMRARGTPPAFLHADVDLAAMHPDRHAFGRDMIRLSELAADHGIPFGIIVWGNNGDADALYADDARRLADAVHKTFRDPSVLPDHVIFQSWAESSRGLRITPTNLPERAPDTHTWLVNTFVQQFGERYRGGR